jgi:hypothetical protein
VTGRIRRLGYGVAPGYKRAGATGFHAMSQFAGTQLLLTCLDGADLFATTDTTCGGKTNLARLGYLMTNPLDL